MTEIIFLFEILRDLVLRLVYVYLYTLHSFFDFLFGFGS